MSSDVRQFLRSSGVTVQWRDTALDFSPAQALGADIRLTRRSEARSLHGLGQMANTHLDDIAARRGSDDKRWDRMHKGLTKGWGDEAPEGYPLLVAWVGANLRSVEAQRRLGSKKATNLERQARKADLSWGKRLIPSIQRRLVGASILLPELHDRIMRLK